MATSADVLDQIEQMFPNTVRERQDQYSLKDAYKTVAWVYACVNLIADCIAGVEFYFYRGDGEFKRDRDVIQLSDFPVNNRGRNVSTDPIVLAFATPREGEIPTISEMIKFQFLLHGLFGESFIYPTAWKGKFPIEFELINPLKLTPKINQKTGRLDFWERRAEGSRPQEKIRPDRIIQMKYPNPYDQFRGMAPLTTARLAIEQDFNMATWNAGFFQAGVRNPIALLLKQTFNENQRKEYISRMRRNFTGFVRGQLPLLVEGGVDLKVLSNTIKDLDFVEGKSLTREELCAIYNVPPAQVGIFRYANYANSREQRSILYLNNLRPKMNYYRDVFQQSILNRWFPGVKCDFYWESVDAFRADPKEEAQTLNTLVQAADKLFQLGYDEKQVSIILKTPEFNQARTLTEDTEDDMDQYEDEQPVAEDEADAEDQELPAAASAPKLIRSKEHYKIQAGAKYLFKYAVKLQSKMARHQGRLDSFIRTFSENLSKNVQRKGTLSTDFWSRQWDQGLMPILEEVFQLGFSDVYRDIKKALPDSIPDSPEFEARSESLRRVVPTISTSVNKDGANKDESVSVIASLPKKIDAMSIVHRFYNIGRFHAYILTQTEEHVWCWGGDAMHQGLHGKKVALGDDFAEVGLNYPGARKLKSVCTCTTRPTLVRREKERITANELSV